VATAATVTITNPSYSVSVNNKTPAAGATITYTATYTNVSSGTYLYWTVDNSSLFSAGATGYFSTSNFPTTVPISVTVVSSLPYDGVLNTVTFRLSILNYSTLGGTVVASNAEVKIQDPSLTYSTPSSLYQYRSGTWTVTVPGASPPSTLYWKNNGSFTSIVTSTSGSYNDYETSGTDNQGSVSGSSGTFSLELSTLIVNQTSDTTITIGWYTDLGYSNLLGTSPSVTVYHSAWTIAISPLLGPWYSGDQIGITISGSNMSTGTPSIQYSSTTSTTGGYYTPSSGNYNTTNSGGTASFSQTLTLFNQGSSTSPTTALTYKQYLGSYVGDNLIYQTLQVSRYVTSVTVTSTVGGSIVISYSCSPRVTSVSFYIYQTGITCLQANQPGLTFSGTATSGTWTFTGPFSSGSYFSGLFTATGDAYNSSGVSYNSSYSESPGKWYDNNSTPRRSTLIISVGGTSYNYNP
jgi:hypothetical protein